MKSQPPLRRALWMYPLGIALVFYVRVLPRYPVGYAFDDALYILAAKSLLLGRYVDLRVPSAPPLTDPLPGFPAVLAPWVAVVHARWEWLKLLPLLMTLLAGMGVWKLGRLWFSPEESVILTALFALNPV